MPHNPAMPTPVIIEVALNGETPKARNAHVPRTPEEISEDGLRCLEAGAAIVHNHNSEAVVGGPGRHEPGPYAEAWKRILARRPDALLYPTMAGAGPHTTIHERYAHIPELAEAGLLRIGLVDPGSVNVGPRDGEGLPARLDRTYLNTFADARHMFATCEELRLGPSISIFEPGFLRVALAMHEGGRMPAGALIKLYFGGPHALFGLLLDALAVFVISLLLVTNRWRMRRFVLSLVVPEHRRRVGYLLDRIWQRLGVYLRAKVIVMSIIGAATYVSLLAIGVPFAVPLAIVVAFGELIPRVGPWLARVPLLSIAALDGWKPFVLTFVASIAIQNAKGFFVSPFVEGDQLEIHPLLVFVAVLVGATLGGLAGAFVAVPLAAVVDILVLEVAVPWRRNRIAQREGATGLAPP